MCVYGSLVYPGMAICVADKAVAKLGLLLLKKCSPVLCCLGATSLVMLWALAFRTQLCWLLLLLASPAALRLQYRLYVQLTTSLETSVWILDVEVEMWAVTLRKTLSYFNPLRNKVELLENT